MRYCFDIETDGFLDTATKVHCIILKNIDTNEILHLNNAQAVKKLEEAELIIGHNIIKFDIPVLRKFYNLKSKAKVFDTIVATRLLFPDIKDQDFKHKNFPKDCIGRHSLKAWGNRVGEYKEQFDTDWKEFSVGMLEYCIQDVHVTHTLFNVIEKKQYSQQAMDLEHNVAEIIFQQEQYGFTFNKEKAQQLYTKLNSRRLELEKQLQKIFLPITEHRVSEKTGKQLKDRVTVFNPSSRHHIAQRLKDKYGWEAKEFTNDGKPKLDDTVLSKLEYPEAKILCEHFLLDKRIAQLATGTQAWLKHEKNNKIHGTCNTNSTVTARASH